MNFFFVVWEVAYIEIDLYFASYSILEEVFLSKKFKNSFKIISEFCYMRGLGGFSPYEQFLQISFHGNSVKKLSVDVHRQCLLFQNEQ